MPLKKLSVLIIMCFLQTNKNGAAAKLHVIAWMIQYRK